MAQYRRILYSVAGKAFLYPDPERSEHLLVAADWLEANTAAEEEYDQVGKALAHCCRRMFSSWETLQPSWVRMFNADIGVNCMPYEGAYVGRQYPGILQGRLLQEYGRAGMVTGDKHEPDHIAVELEFMAWLCQLEAEAEGEDDIERYRSWQRDFLNDHLLVWVPLFRQRSTLIGDTDKRYIELIEHTHEMLDLERRTYLRVA